MVYLIPKWVFGGFSQRVFPPPNDTPMFWKFLNGNIAISSEMWKAQTSCIIKIYYAVFVTKGSVLEFKIDFSFFSVSLAGG